MKIEVCFNDLFSFSFFFKKRLELHKLCQNVSEEEEEHVIETGNKTILKALLRNSTQLTGRKWN